MNATATSTPRLTADSFATRAERRAWLDSLPEEPTPRKPRNSSSRHSDLARPCLLWWRSTLVSMTDGTAWPDLSADNDDQGERVWAVRDVNPAPKHSAEAIMAALPPTIRVSVSTVRRNDGMSGPPKRRRYWPARDMHNGRTRRLGGLEFTTEAGEAIQVLKENGEAKSRRYVISAGTMLRINGRRVPADSGRYRDSRSASATLAQRRSSDWYKGWLDGAVLPYLPTPNRLFAGLSVRSGIAVDGMGEPSGVRGQVDHVQTVEDALIDREQMQEFRRSQPAEAEVLDLAMTARRFADLAANDSAATGRRRLKDALDALEAFLAA